MNFVATPVWVLGAVATALATVMVAGCGPSPSSRHNIDESAYQSSYQIPSSPPRALVGATLLTGTGERIDNGVVVIVDGLIAQVGSADSIAIADGVEIIDVSGRWITPGIIDIHSHIGAGPLPATKATADANENSDINRADVWVEHSVYTQDRGFNQALAAGVTTLQILPGSSILFGGRSVIVKNVMGRQVNDMKFPGAQQGLKMACGENVRGSLGPKESPQSRMGVLAEMRAAFIRAKEYAANPNAPVDLKLDTLARVMEGEIPVHQHCYRADDMANIISLSHEMGYKVRAFHHATEAYKIADLLAKEGICAAMWADWWGQKAEMRDGIPGNIALVHNAGACAIVHSDSVVGVQRLNQEAAKAMAWGERMGIAIPPEQAIRWLTTNPAYGMGIDGKTGSLEVGKMADLAVWNQNPFSSYALAQQVFIDGVLRYDRNDRALQPVGDSALGYGAGYWDDSHTTVGGEQP